MLVRAQISVLHQAGTVGVQFPTGGRDDGRCRAAEGMSRIRPTGE